MNEALLRAAIGMEKAGNSSEAARLYGEVLKANPAHFQALYQLAYLDFSRARYESAERLFAQAVQVHPDADAHFARGCALQKLKRHEAAVEAFGSALALDGRHADALINRAVSLMELKRLSEAAASFQAALALQPARAELWLAHGDCLAAMNHYADAIGSYDKAMALKPDLVEAVNNRGAALFVLKRCEEALAAYDSGLARGLRSAALLIGRGLALMELRRETEALSNFDAALALEPGYADALHHRGRALLALQRYGDALTSLDQSLVRAPHNPDVLVVRGIALKQLGRLDEALASQSRALSVQLACVNALVNRASLLFELKRYEDAIKDCYDALAIDPDAPYVRGDLAYYRLQCCDWQERAGDVEAIRSGLSLGKRVIQPFMNIAVSDSPEAQLQCARIWAENECPRPERPLWRGERYQHERVRVAYLSGDFGSHAVTQLMAGVFEHHDRARFETIAISFGADDRSTLRRRAASAFERFIDGEGKGDLDIARLIRSIEIDIAVDLMGYTGRSRPRIFAHRVAPVQAQYLGYAGTMGTEAIDYILADRIVVPETHRDHYSEKAVHLPGSYMPHDAKRGIAPPPHGRVAAGLPENGFVFCSFNNSYKFSPPVLDIWTRLLRAVAGSVLWLPQSNPAAMRNLKREALQRGVEPERLIFAAYMPDGGEHLARLALADLFLDTLPFNAHSTAMDALWAGLPVLTCLGSTFAGRVAASLNHAAGLPELVTQSLDDYEALALKLASDPEALAAIKQKLARNRATCPLFDTARFTRNLEAAFVVMHERAQRGLAPAAFAVAP